MKKISILILATVIISCDPDVKKSTDTSQATDNSSTVTSTSENKAKTDPQSVTAIMWIDPQVRDMGKIGEGQEMEVTWRYKNSGNKPLIITNVEAPCGCTIPEKPKEPIAPGGEGIIRAKFNSNNRPGMNHKQVFVDANTEPNRTVLTFNVEVVKKA